MARIDWADGEVVNYAVMNSLGNELNSLSARLTAIESTSFQTVTITTTGATFTPVVELVSGSTAVVHWNYPSGSATGLTPSISFGSAGTRTVAMTVVRGTATEAIADVRTLNLGYDHLQDPSPYSPAASYDKAPEAILGISNIKAMTGLVRFLASNTALSGSIDFTGMSNLVNIECYDANISAVTLTGCTSLARLQLESNAISALNLNPVAANLYDFRCAGQAGGTLALTPMTSNFANLFHFCTRDNATTNQPPFSRFPALLQLWNWNSGQTGVLAPASSVVQSIASQGNAYTNVDLTGCSALSQLWLYGNVGGLPQATVDDILVKLAGFTVSGGDCNLTACGPPSPTGAAARATLVTRGWTVTVDAGTVPGTPTGLSTASANAQVTLFWTAPSPGGSAITSYTVRYRPVSGGAYTTVTGISAGATSYAITGLTNGTAYEASVAAVNALGTGSYATNVTGTPTAPTVLFFDDFHRANGAVGNGWTDLVGGFGATIVSNQLSRSGTGSYQLLQNAAGATLPVNYSVELNFPHSRISDTFFFIFGRGAGGTGVRVGWEGGAVSSGFAGLCIGDVLGPTGGDVTVVADNPFPASWAVNQNHTLRMQMVGTLVNVYADGVLVGHGTITLNATVTPTGFGICGGTAGLYNSVTVT